MSDKGFPISEYVRDELDARGLSFRQAAGLLDGNVEADAAWLELLCSDALWRNYDVVLTRSEADQLEKLFGISSDAWIKIDQAFRVTKKAKDGADDPNSRGDN